MRGMFHWTHDERIHQELIVESQDLRRLTMDGLGDTLFSAPSSIA